MWRRNKTGDWRSQTRFEASAEWVVTFTSAQLDSNQRVGLRRQRGALSGARPADGVAGRVRGQRRVGRSHHQRPAGLGPV